MTMTAEQRLKPYTSYRHHFDTQEIDAIGACMKDHGFAIVRNVLNASEVAEMKESIRQTLNPNNNLKPAETRLHVSFVEVSKPLLQLLENERVMSIMRPLIGNPSDGMTMHRSAAILKNVGTGVGEWHTDYCYYEGAPRTYNDFLNRGEWPNGFWFYLDGTRPERGGLAVIEDSHAPDWRAPEGFEFTENRKSFHRIGESKAMYAKMDVPGCVPLISDPGDLIIFAARTYHGVFPHNGTEPRSSCAFICRPGRSPWKVGWEWSKETRAFVEKLPAHLKPYFDHYTSIDTSWRPGARDASGLPSSPSKGASM